ncbi:hypothetical protein ACA910_018057 [Epithemia clementina (nom. ined.)]
MMCKSYVLFLSAVFLSLSFVTSCDLCPDSLWVYGTYGPIPARGNWYIGPGKTCNMLYLDMASKSNGSPECINAVSKYRNVCCYNNRPGTQAPQPRPPTDNPAVKPGGTEPVCEICGGNGSVPGKPNTMIFSNFIPVGRDSCNGLYRQGLEENILAALCYPLQLFVNEPCACTKPKTPSPTALAKEYAAPTPSPTWPVMKERTSANSKNALKEAFLIGGYRSCRGNCINKRRRGLRGVQSQP